MFISCPLYLLLKKGIRYSPRGGTCALCIIKQNVFVCLRSFLLYLFEFLSLIKVCINRIMAKIDSFQIN